MRTGTGWMGPTVTASRFCAAVVLVCLAIGSGCGRGSVGASGVRRPRVGEALPYRRFLDSGGEIIDVAAYVGHQHVVLVFMRGFHGYVCPYCTGQTAEIAAAGERFRALNAAVLIVYPGPAEEIPTFLSAVRAELQDSGESSFPFRVLLDVDLAAASALGIEGDLALPSTFILDGAGVIAYMHVGRDPSDRPAVAELLQVVKDLGPPRSADAN